ncbi:MAG: glycosyltransferase [Bacteroidota bacterium]|nr:glycosyltransferase [Bacteroidota bacterium]
MEIYGFSFSLIELIAFGLLFLAFIYQLYFYLRYLNGVLRLRLRINKNKVSFLTEQPPVSVIICAKDEADNLRKFLPFVLQQEYPDFEVIVINDGSTDETDILLRDLSKEYPNLRTTFVPVGANNLSTKKLGLTLGIKAAKNEMLLFTDADCMPEDKMWIARMARNFTPETDFILGYGAYLHKKGFLNRLITYDTLFIALQYMGMAIARKPYMGVGRNLAYRKDTFFAHKGFASTLRLSSGDDDLMVNQASNSRNTRVEIAPDSITWSEPNRTFKSWFYQKERHLSVSSYYKASSKLRLSIEPMTRGLFYLSLILSLIVGSLIVQLAAVVLFLTRFIIQLSVINKSSRHFGERKYILTLPLFDILFPLISLYILTIGRLSSKGKTAHWK